MKVGKLKELLSYQVTSNGIKSKGERFQFISIHKYSIFQIRNLFWAIFVVAFSALVIANDEEIETVTYIIESESPHTDITEELDLVDRDDSVQSNEDEKSARHYEHYAPFADNPFRGKHEPEPHYTRYKYPYDPHHNPHQYLPDEHYPNVAIKYHPIHKRKRRSPDHFSHVPHKPVKHSSYPHHDFAPQYNDPSAYGGKPHYPAHDFPLEHNNPSSYGGKHAYPDHHLDLKYNNPSIYKKDPHHKPQHHHYKRHLPHQEGPKHFEQLTPSNFIAGSSIFGRQYGHISHSGSTHSLFPHSFNKKLRNVQKRNVLDDKHLNVHSTYISYADNPFAGKHEPEPEYNAYNYGLPGEVLHARVSRKVMSNYSNLQLTPKYDSPTIYEHLSRSQPNGKNIK